MYLCDSGCCHESHVALLSASACLLYVQRLWSSVAPPGLKLLLLLSPQSWQASSQTLLLLPVHPLGVFKSFVASQVYFVRISIVAFNAAKLIPICIFARTFENWFTEFLWASSIAYILNMSVSMEMSACQNKIPPPVISATPYSNYPSFSFPCLSAVCSNLVTMWSENTGWRMLAQKLGQLDWLFFIIIRL